VGVAEPLSAVADLRPRQVRVVCGRYSALLKTSCLKGGPVPGERGVGPLRPAKLARYHHRHQASEVLETGTRDGTSLIRGYEAKTQ